LKIINIEWEKKYMMDFNADFENKKRKKFQEKKRKKGLRIILSLWLDRCENVI